MKRNKRVRVKDAAILIIMLMILVGMVIGSFIQYSGLQNYVQESGETNGDTN